MADIQPITFKTDDQMEAHFLAHAECVQVYDSIEAKREFGYGTVDLFVPSGGCWIGYRIKQHHRDKERLSARRLTERVRRDLLNRSIA